MPRRPAARPRPARRADGDRRGRAAERGARGFDHLAAGRVALLGRLRHRAGDHRVERLGQVGARLRRPAGGGSVMCANITATSVSRSYGFLPGQRLVEHAAEGVDVGRGRDLLAPRSARAPRSRPCRRRRRPASARARRRRSASRSRSPSGRCARSRPRSSRSRGFTSRWITPRACAASSAPGDLLEDRERLVRVVRAALA